MLSFFLGLYALNDSATGRIQHAAEVAESVLGEVKRSDCSLMKRAVGHGCLFADERGMSKVISTEDRVVFLIGPPHDTKDEALPGSGDSQCSIAETTSTLVRKHEPCVGIAHEESFRTLVIVTDSLAGEPVYYATIDGLFVFSSHILPLAAMQSHFGQTNLRLDAGVRLVSSGFLWGSGTILEGIERLPYAHILQVEPGQVSCRPCWRWSFQENAVSSRQKHVEALGSEFIRITEGLGNRFKEYDISLTGGYDSRAIIGAVVRCGKADRIKRAVSYAWTDGREAAHESRADDRAYAKLLAKRYGWMLDEVDLGPNDVHARLVQSLLLTSGGLAVIDEVSAWEQLGPASRPLLHGDQAFYLTASRPKSLTDAAASAGIAALPAMRAAVEFYFPHDTLRATEKQHRELLAACPGTKGVNAREWFHFTERACKMMATWRCGIAHWRPTLGPLLSPNLLRQWLGVPSELRADRSLFTDMVATMFPEEHALGYAQYGSGIPRELRLQNLRKHATEYADVVDAIGLLTGARRERALRQVSGRGDYNVKTWPSNLLDRVAVRGRSLLADNTGRLLRSPCTGVRWDPLDHAERMVSVAFFLERIRGLA